MDAVYERALEEVDQNGKFQKNFNISYNLLFVAFWGMAYMNIILTLVVTPHNCKLPEKPNDISENQWKSKYIPKNSDVSSEIFSSCLVYRYPDESNKTKGCDAYEYDHTWYKSTVPLEYNWVCDKEINIANAFAYSRLSEAIGSIVFGWLGDVYGRRVAYISSIALIIGGRVISVLAGDSFILFATGCVVASFPSWSAFQSVTVITLEISSPERRTTAVTIRAVAWTMGLCVLPFCYWWFQNWKHYLIITTSPLIVFLLLSWKIIESPRWLWIQGRRKSCIRQLKRIAKTNGKKLSIEIEQELLAAKPTNKVKSYGALALFSNWNIAFNTLLELFSWVCVTISYTVLLMTAGEKTDGNPFLEFAWQAAAEMPGNLLGAWLSDKVGRRYAGATSYSITAFIWILVTLRLKSTNSRTQTWWIGTILLVINRLFINATYYVVSLFNMELYPTCLRQSGMSLGNVVSSGASALAPYIVFLGHRTGPILPGIILATSSLFGIMCVLLLPETLNVKLPETLEEAKLFGKRNEKQPVKFKSSTNVGTKAVVLFVAQEDRLVDVEEVNE